MWLRTAVLTAVIAAGCAGRGTRDATPARAGAADFRAINVRDLAGAPLALSSVLGARATLVSFWAPWCEPCRREQPELQRLSRAASACGGAVVGVAVGEGAPAVSVFARDNGLTFPEFTDDAFELADAMDQRRIPATVVFDREARIVFTGGALADAAMEALSAAMPPRADGTRCPMRAP